MDGWREGGIKIWLLKFSIDKCKLTSYGRVININYSYQLDGISLQKVNNINDLGIANIKIQTFDRQHSRGE